MSIPPQDDQESAYRVVCPTGVGVADQFTNSIYSALHELARRQVRQETPSLMLAPTDLVHEAYLQLASQNPGDCKGRTQFLALAAKIMRHILVDEARKRRTQKRGGDRNTIPLDSTAIMTSSSPIDVLSLHDALTRLATVDETEARVVELRFFGGMTISEVAEDLEVSERMVARYWAHARAWLHGELSGQAEV